MTDCIFCKNLPKVMENELAYCLIRYQAYHQGPHARYPQAASYDHF